MISSLRTRSRHSPRLGLLAAFALTLAACGGSGAPAVLDEAGIDSVLSQDQIADVLPEFADAKGTYERLEELTSGNSDADIPEPIDAGAVSYQTRGGLLYVALFRLATDADAGLAFGSFAAAMTGEGGLNDLGIGDQSLQIDDEFSHTAVVRKDDLLAVIGLVGQLETIEEAAKSADNVEKLMKIIESKL
jgi:hypothetical protein